MVDRFFFVEKPELKGRQVGSLGTKDTFRILADTASLPMKRLLESPQAFLDEAQGVDFDQEESSGKVYWLRYDKSKDKLSVQRQPPTSIVADRLLRLELRNTNSSARPQVQDSNVGTELLHSDEWVNIWEFRIDPDQRCHHHTHRLEYCFTNLTESLTQALDQQGDPTEKPNIQTVGQTIYVEQASLGSHAVRNVGDTTFLQFIVEFKF